MKKRLSVTLDVDVLRKVDKLCELEDRNTSNMINLLLKKALADYFDENGEKRSH